MREAAVTSLPPGLDALPEFVAAQKGELTGVEPDLRVQIPMRDGVLLAGDVYLPPGHDRAVPSIVQITPYTRSAALWSREARWFADRGYAAVVVDTRGCADSGGDFHWFVHDGTDGYDVVEWVAEQDWCDGAVGTTGISYMGWVQWALAAERPPHLTCMISSAPAGRWMQDIPYTWGILQSYFPLWLYGLQSRDDPRPVEPVTDLTELLSTWPITGVGQRLGLQGPSWDDLIDHSTLDEFWQALRFDRGYAEIDVPCLHVAGWYDLENLTGSLHHYEQMMQSSPAASDQTLLIGPWSHAGVRYPHRSYDGTDAGPSASVDMNEVHLQFFDRWLRGDESRWTHAPVVVFDTGRGDWDTGGPWMESADARELYLAEPGLLTVSSPVEASESVYRFDPSEPPARMSFRAYPVTDYPFDETEADQRSDVLTWTTDVLEASFRLTGWSRLMLHASTDGTDTDWHVKITDVDPEGRSRRVSSGCVRASSRHGLDRSEPVSPDLSTEYAVELGPAHHTFMPGHRLRVQLSSSDFPWFTLTSNRFDHPLAALDPRPCVNTVHSGGPSPSRIVLGTTALDAMGRHDG